MKRAKKSKAELWKHDQEKRRARARALQEEARKILHPENPPEFLVPSASSGEPALHAIVGIAGGLNLQRTIGYHESISAKEAVAFARWLLEYFEVPK